MRTAILKFFLIYLLFVVVFILMKPLFMLLYLAEITPTATDWFSVIYHGFSMDLSVGAYLTIIPGLLLALSLIPTRTPLSLTQNREAVDAPVSASQNREAVGIPVSASQNREAVGTPVSASQNREAVAVPALPGMSLRLLNYYIIFAALLVAFLYTLDFGLYGSWGFRLDSTPFFYIFSSPRSALASLQWWHYPLVLLSMATIFLLIYLPYHLWIAPLSPSGSSVSLSAPPSAVVPRRSRGKAAIRPLLMLLLTGALFLPIRGSFTVSTMNPSRAYFSTNQRLNHAALNPLFTLLYSASHQTDFASQYRFMPDDEAAATLRSLLFCEPDFASTSAPLDGCPEQCSDSTASRPNVILIILESFSAHLLPSLGGENIALGLDSLAREGVSFTNFYASSFRTDRGLAAILSSFPAPTNTSLLKYVEKFENLPSLPGELKRQGGYSLNYYYGGDANFTNMQAYLVSMGFDNIISDRDFPLSEKTSKWGAHDDVLFNRALADIASKSGESPSFTVIQTSSSHEPFDVPYHSLRYPTNSEDDLRRNAFAFTDSCLFTFVESLRTLPNWDNTLVVITADHYGCYPRNLDSAPSRHHIPLILLGGASGVSPRVVTKTAMQTDLGATLLHLLALDPSSLKFSRNILSPRTASTAIFTEPSLVGILTPTDTLVYNPDADAIIYASPLQREAVPGRALPGEAPLLQGARAFLRSLYATLDSLGRQ